MFQASINKQFKSRFSGVNGAVDMGAFTLVFRIFEGRNLHGYFLIDNLKGQHFILIKSDFEKFCTDFKIDLERSSNIPRLPIQTQGKARSLEIDGFSMPLCEVTVPLSKYIQYMNNLYLSAIGAYVNMTVKGMNFTHLEVIHKMINSQYLQAIETGYTKGEKVIKEGLLQKNPNAEEFEVLLLAVAYLVGAEIKEVDFKKLCKEQTGAKQMRTILDSMLTKSHAPSVNDMFRLIDSKLFSNAFWREHGQNIATFPTTHLEVGASFSPLTNAESDYASKYVALYYAKYNINTVQHRDMVISIAVRKPTVRTSVSCSATDVVDLHIQCINDFTGVVKTSITFGELYKLVIDETTFIQKLHDLAKKAFESMQENGSITNIVKDPKAIGIMMRKIVGYVQETALEDVSPLCKELGVEASVHYLGMYRDDENTWHGITKFILPNGLLRMVISGKGTLESTAPLRISLFGSDVEKAITSVKYTGAEMGALLQTFVRNSKPFFETDFYTTYKSMLISSIKELHDSQQ